MKRSCHTLLPLYQQALHQYLAPGASNGVEAALQLGKQAVDLRLGTLDLAQIHEEALLHHVPLPDRPAIRKRIAGRSRRFFAAAVTAMEKTHRSAAESNALLIRLNKALSLRTQDLAASNEQLKQEVTRRKAAEETLRHSERHAITLLAQSRCLQEQLKYLSHRVILVQEEERKRISRELHDVVAQMLSGINVRLTALKMEAVASTKGLGRKISRTQKLVEKSVDIVHRFARELRPAVLDDLGLIPALHSYAKAYSRETGIQVHLRIIAGVEELHSDKRIALFRVTQEALSNVARHARASRVDIIIQAIPDAVRMQIKDDGKAFDVDHVLRARKKNRLGLLGMRERVEMVGGTFSVQSAPGSGTTVCADIPLRRPKKKDVPG